MPTPYFPVFGNRKQDAQTIHLPMVAYTRVNGVAVTTASSSANVTTTLSSRLGTAARNSQPVPLQVSTSEEMRGVVLSANGGTVQVYNAANGEKINVDGEEVYGLLSETSGAYTVDFKIGSSASVATIPAGTTVDLEVAYRFDLHELPSDSLIAITARNVREELQQAGGQMAEELVITTANTVPNLSFAPNITTAAIFFDYRGWHMSANLPRSVMTVDPAGAVSYDSTTSKVDLAVGEVLTAYYARK